MDRLCLFQPANQASIKDHSLFLNQREKFILASVYLIANRLIITVRCSLIFKFRKYKMMLILINFDSSFDKMSQRKDLNSTSLQNSVIEIVTVGGQKNIEAQVPAPKPFDTIIQPYLPHIQAPELQVQAPYQDQVQPSSQQNLTEKQQEQKSEELGGEAQENEDSQNLEQESNEQSSSQKSDKKRKSNGQSADQRKDELPTSRKCFNKLCSSKKIYKKIRSRVQDNKYRFFCKNCYENYYNNLYCEFCEQIYSNSCQNEDDDKWIGCDRCERWNHIECEKKIRNKSINQLKDKDILYQCLVCSQKTKTTTDKNKKQEKQQTEEKIATKQKIQINRDQRTLIFHKKIETFPNLQYFLQNYSFRLWINQSQIRQDIQHLRAVCLKNNQQDPVKNKFKKAKND